jgi:hypothetical protein
MTILTVPPPGRTETAARQPSEGSVSRAWSRAVDAAAMSIVAGLCLTFFLHHILSVESHWLTWNFFEQQDVVLLSVMALLLKLISRLAGRGDFHHTSYVFRGGDRVTAWLCADPVRSRHFLMAFTMLASLAGTFFVMMDYPLSRDEVMANFDAVSLSAGDMMAAIPPEWRRFAPAMLPEFSLSVAGNAAWASAYLPGNAAIRALFLWISAPQLANPLLAAIAVWAIFGVARRVWPDHPDAAIVSALLFATSSQVLFTAMTSYAMTALLALNLVWLNLFLRNDRIGHAGALAIGALACGLHQIAFHPLFVAPFIAQLWLTRRWRGAVFHTLGYAAICLFWLSYRQFATAYAGVQLAAEAGVGVGYLAQTLSTLLGELSLQCLDLMILNLQRFAAWQNIVILPLLLLAIGAWRSDLRVPRPLFACLGGILLALGAVTILMPYQAHGWGYRYLHGMIGSICLFGAYGWLALTPKLDAAQVRRSLCALVGLSLAGLVVLGVLQATMVRQFTAPYERASAALARANADTVLVDHRGLVFAADLVRNDPYLRNHPKIMLLLRLEEADIRILCARGSVALFGRDEGKSVGMIASDGDLDAEMPSLASEPRARAVASRAGERRALLTKLGCGQPLQIMQH